jgi:hypothetical protein
VCRRAKADEAAIWNNPSWLARAGARVASKQIATMRYRSHRRDRAASNCAQDRFHFRATVGQARRPMRRPSALLVQGTQPI